MKWMRMGVAVLLAVIGAAGAAAAAGDQVIFVVRHAERTLTNDPTASKRMMADDPPLSPAGQARAARLAAMLGSAGIQRIYTTEFQRARQTAAPLADKLKLKPVMAPAKDPAPLLAQLRRATGNVLVVGHANTIPDLLKKLGVKDAVTIGDDEYDNLFVLVRRVGGPPTLVRLRY